MITISRAQFASIESMARSRFQQQLAELVRELRPDAIGQLSPQHLQRVIDAILEEAAALGFETEFEIAVFGAGVLQHGRAFFSDPAHPLYQVVTRHGVEARLRANQLLYELGRTDNRLST